MEGEFSDKAGHVLFRPCQFNLGAEYVAMVFFCSQRCNHCCCLCWVLTFIRILHTSATSSYCGPVGNIEPSLQVKVDLRWVLSVFIENNLESYVCKLASLVWFFFAVLRKTNTQHSPGTAQQLNLDQDLCFATLWLHFSPPHCHSYRRKAVNMSAWNFDSKTQPTSWPKKSFRSIHHCFWDSHTSVPPLMLLVACPGDIWG